MNQIAVLSGKGGTGKTTLAAMVVQRAGQCVVADCDVDSSHLALVLPGSDGQAHDFYAGRRAWIRPVDCCGCGQCEFACPFDAISTVDGEYAVTGLLCAGCGACALACPAACIEFSDNMAGQWWSRHIDSGVLVHGALRVAQGNSGKLVTRLRSAACEIAAREGMDFVLVDGPPGIGCPVHATLTGTNLAVLVAEASPSGFHDLLRVLQVCKSHRVASVVALNRCGTHPQIEQDMLAHCQAADIPVWARIPFEIEVARLLADGRLPTQLESPAGREFRQLADRVIETCAEQRDDCRRLHKNRESA
jgi:MinD superfamily P-loop ATPase